jgi:hypothetical protein
MTVKRSEREGVLKAMSFRVTPALRAALEEASSQNGRSMTTELERRLEQSFEWERAFRSREHLLAEHKAKIAELDAGNAEAMLPRLGYRKVVDPRYGGHVWVPPGQLPFPDHLKSGFIDPEKVHEFSKPVVTMTPAAQEAFRQVVLAAVEEALDRREAQKLERPISDAIPEER